MTTLQERLRAMSVTMSDVKEAADKLDELVYQLKVAMEAQRCECSSDQACRFARERDVLEANNKELLEALRSCSVKFKKYTEHHLAKGDDGKAASNALMLKLCETVIAKATGGGV